MLLKLIVVVIGMILGLWLIDDFDPDLVKGKRVLVTGASTGIGEQLAYQYAKHGANVVVTARRENRLKQVVKECESIGNKGQRHHYIVADMMDIASIGNLIKTAAEKLGGLDVVVLNHVSPYTCEMWEGSAENFTYIERIMRVNFESYVHLASHALPYIEENNGSIVVVSSFSGKFAQPCMAAYSSAKFALGGFFGSLRQELRMRERDVSVTLCILGLIDTESTIKLITDYRLDSILNSLVPASPSDTALAMLKAGAMRVREVFYPNSLYFQQIIGDLFPEYLDDFTRLLYVKSE